jgi:cGMP-dependent protein kinase
MTILS